MNATQPGYITPSQFRQKLKSGPPNPALNYNWILVIDALVANRTLNDQCRKILIELLPTPLIISFLSETLHLTPAYVTLASEVLSCEVLLSHMLTSYQTNFIITSDQTKQVSPILTRSVCFNQSTATSESSYWERSSYWGCRGIRTPYTTLY